MKNNRHRPLKQYSHVRHTMDISKTRLRFDRAIYGYSEKIFLLCASTREQLSGVARKWPTQSLIQGFRGCIIRRLSVYTYIPHKEGNCMEGPPLFNFGIWESLFRAQYTMLPRHPQRRLSGLINQALLFSFVTQ